jgi:hypothetical protein
MTAEGVTIMKSTGNGNKWWWSTSKFLVVGLAAGAGVGFAVGKFIKHGHPGIQADGADVTALGLAGFYICTTMLLLWIANDRMRLARVLEGKGADIPASDDEVRSFVYQAVVMALAGILLALPIFAARLFAENFQHRQISFAGIVLLFAVQTFYNVRLWRISDEFVRSTMATTAALTFAIGQGGLFLRAAAEHMSLVKPVSSWDLLVIMMQLYIFVGLFISVRTLDKSRK